MSKKINVVIPAYNCGKFLDHTILSVFSQITKHNISVLISNDCSTDNTLEVLERLKNTYYRDNFEIIIFNQEKNLGEINNTKFLLDNCDGEYIAYLDADDFWINPNKLKIQIDFMETNKNCSMCFTGYLEYTDGIFVPSALGNSWLSPPLNINIENSITPDMFLSSNCIGSSSRVFRNYNNIIKDYFNSFPYSDWPMNFEISLLGDVKFINFVTYCYRKHNQSLTSKLDLESDEYKEKFNKRVNILTERYNGNI